MEPINSIDMESEKIRKLNINNTLQEKFIGLTGAFGGDNVTPRRFFTNGSIRLEKRGSTKD
jgi:hypothetical protein